MIGALALAITAALVVGAITTWLVVHYAAALGLIDRPTPRSSHRRPVPRAGGLGIVAGVGAGALAITLLGYPPGHSALVLLAAAGCIAAIGLVDDFRSLPAPPRLAGQVLVAIVTVTQLGGVDRLPLPPPLDLGLGWLAGPLTVLWLVAVTNFYNFMDGIDGLAAAQGCASCAGIAVAAWSEEATTLALIVAAATIGFLVFNWSPARVFMGDVGSTSLGFTLAGLPLLSAPQQHPLAVFAVGAGLTLFLLDPAETLLRLIRKGQRPGVAHRAHSYQALTADPAGHARITVAIAACGLALALAAALSFRHHELMWPVALLALAIFGVERFLAVRATRRALKPASKPG